MRTLASTTLFLVCAALSPAAGFGQTPAPTPVRKGAFGELDPALLFAHPGLITGATKAAASDLLAALEADIDSPFALDALRRINALWQGDSDALSGADALTRLLALGERARDARTELLAEELALSLARRSRFADQPLALPPDLRNEFITRWLALGPIGPADSDVMPLIPALEGSPEVLGEGRRYGLDYPATLVPAGTAAVPLAWRDVRRAAHAARVAPARDLWPVAGFVFALAYVEDAEATELGQPVERILEISSDDAFRAYWNGALCHDAARVAPDDVAPTRRVKVEVAPGPNALLVRLAMEDAPRIGARLLDVDLREVRFTDLVPEGAHPRVPRTEVVGEVFDPRDAAVDVAAAGPYAAALSVVRRTYAQRPDEALAIPVPDAPAGGSDAVVGPRAAWWSARLFALGRARHLDGEILRRALLEALDALEAETARPPSAWLRRIAWLSSEDRPLEALALAEEWIEAAPKASAPRAARFQALGDIDPTGTLASLDAVETLRAFPGLNGVRTSLAGWLAREGDRVGALDHTFELLQRTGDLGGIDAFLERLKGAQDPRLEFLLDRVRAERVYFPDDNRLRKAEAKLLEHLGRDAERVALAETEVREHPGHPGSWWELASVRLERGDFGGARAALTEELRFRPSDRTSRELLIELGADDPAERFFAAFAPDKEAALARAREGASASVVEALDSGLVYVFPDGSSHSRNSSLSFATDRAGVEALSALPLRDEPRVVRVDKADGSVLEPTNAGGEWVLPTLEVGDAIELVWDQRLGAHAPGALPTSHTWRFASFERAFPTSRWVVYVPNGLLRGRIQAKNFEGSHGEIPWQDGIVHVFETSLPRQVPEPGMPPYQELLPIAAFGDDDGRSDDWRGYRAFLANETHLPSDLRSEADAFIDDVRATTPTGDAGALARALYEAVDGRTRQFEGDSSAAAVWQTQRGWPLFLYGALLERAGVEHEWGILETGVSPEVLPSPETIFEGDFDLGSLILRLDAGAEPVWVLPGQAPGTPFGELPNACAGARAFVLETGGVREEFLPRAYLEDRWDADITLEYDVASDGSARVRGRFENAGPEGVMVLGQVRQATAQQRQGFAQQQAGSLAPGLNVERAEVILDGSRGPGLVVEFEGTRPGFTTPVDSGEERASLPFVPLGLTQGFGPAERRWPLRLNSPARLRATVVVRLADGLSFLRGPESIACERVGFRVALAVERPSGSELRYVQSMQRTTLQLGPAELPPFLARMAEVEGELERALWLQRSR